MFSFWFPKFIFAADPTLTIKNFIYKVELLILNPLILLMFAAALILFLYGVVESIRGAESSDEREKGRNHILYGLIGMFVMASVFGIMKLLARTFGADTANIP